MVCALCLTWFTSPDRSIYLLVWNETWQPLNDIFEHKRYEDHYKIFTHICNSTPLIKALYIQFLDKMNMTDTDIVAMSLNVIYQPYHSYAVMQMDKVRNYRIAFNYPHCLKMYS